MGRFLKKGNDGFRAVRNGEYVDKSRLIEIVNATLNTERQFTCVSRARRFGKSVGAEMLYSYYDQWSADRELFVDLQVYSSPSFSRHFRHYPVIYLDMTDFVTRYHADEIVEHIHLDIIKELKEVFPDFHEYSVVQPGPMAECFGFTSEEVRRLCAQHQMDYDTLAEWYDGYQIGACKEVFNPTSVMTALYNQYCDSYWANTGAYDTVAYYIRMNFDGLKDDVIRLLAGESCSVDTSSFQNDLNVVRSKDDVLTLLIHLGYLSYDRNTRTCRIPNREVAIEFKNIKLLDS